MIERLTPEQEAKFPEYVEKWTKIGISTEPFTLEDCKDIVNQFQEKVLEANRTEVILVDNVQQGYNLSCAYTENSSNVDVEKEKNVHRNGFVMPYTDGCYSASIFGFYSFFINELNVELDPELLAKYLLWQELSKFGPIYFLDNVAIVCQKPLEIYFNEQKQLHKDGGPALVFRGECPPIYALNGVRVPEYLAMTDSSKLSMDFFLKEENADVKAEFIRKFGIERMLELGVLVDSYKNYDKEWWTKSEYELFDMAKVFPGISYAPHLKMVNQTTKVFHVEAVSPACNTITQALKERFGGDYEIDVIM
jgi:hypothetical protein